jgi:uncharacterized protein YecA (UPF0149 family)
VSQTSEKTLKAVEFLTNLCESRHEMLTVLMHLVSAGLQEEIKAQRLTHPDDVNYVMSYLVKITSMLDGVFDVNSTKSVKEWVAVGEPADPQTEKLVRDMLTRDGGTIVDLGDAGRNDPCPCGSGKKYKRCHGAG